MTVKTITDVKNIIHGEITPTERSVSIDEVYIETQNDDTRCEKIYYWTASIALAFGFFAAVLVAIGSVIYFMVWLANIIDD